MRKFFDRLSPLERRFLIGFAVIVFIVINWVFVKPHFNDWNLVEARLQKAKDTMVTFNTEIAKKPEYERQIALLEKEGAPVQQEDQASDFMRNIQSQAVLSHVGLLSTTPQQNSRTNQFFLEKIMAITVQTGEKELVDFVYNLGAGGSMIRVRDLSLRPDANRQQLAGTIRLVASYQKKVPAGPGGPARRPAAPAATASNTTATPNAQRP
jgi:hypothetical protein